MEKEIIKLSEQVKIEVIRKKINTDEVATVTVFKNNKSVAEVYVGWIEA